MCQQKPEKLQHFVLQSKGTLSSFECKRSWLAQRGGSIAVTA